MADSTELSQTVTDAAQSPAATTVDGMQKQLRDLKDLDDVSRRRQSDRAVKKTHRGIFFSKLVPPGTT